MTFLGRGPGGPKQMLWARSDKQQLETFFARMSAPSRLKWMFAHDGEVPTQMSASVGDRLFDVVSDVFGTLVRKGAGSQPGQGSCHTVWLVDEQEVAEGTPHAIGLVRGGSAEMEIQLDDGSTRWCMASRLSLCAEEEPPTDYSATAEAVQVPPSPQPLPEPPPAPPSPMAASPTSPPSAAQAGEVAAVERARTERLERQAQRERRDPEMRKLIRCLVANWRPPARSGKSQASLARLIGLEPQRLSEYMSGKGKNGPLSRPELDSRHFELHRALVRVAAPLEIQPGVPDSTTTTACDAACDAASADAAASAASAASSTVSSSSDASSSTAPFKQPSPPPPPKAPVLTMRLGEVEGAKEGGFVYITALGVAVGGDPRWQIERPGGGQPLRLRNGLRGRRTLTARGSSPMAGRSFEWWVDVMDARHDAAHHGGPLWVARELGRHSEVGKRIIGRWQGADGRHAGPSSPGLLTKAIAAHCGAEERLLPIPFTGLIHPAMHELLDAAEGAAGLTVPLPPPPMPSFGARAGGLAKLKPGGSQLHEVGEYAGVAFLEAMESVVPGDPEGVFRELMRRPSFRNQFIPAEWRNGLSKGAIQKQLMDSPFVKGFADVYHALQGFRAKRQHLSMFAPHFPYKVTMAVFGIKRKYAATHRIENLLPAPPPL